MKLLFAFSNWKWTGPAEPAVNLAAALAARGHDVAFAVGRCPHADLENRVASEARARGLRLVEDVALRKHFDPVSGVRDLRALTERIARERFDVVHAHLLNDHLLAGAAARRARTGAAVIRSVYGGRDLSAPLRTRLAFSRLADGVVATSESAASEVRARTSIAAERVFVVPGAADAARFAPERLAPLRDAARRELGLSERDVACGIVARIQRHRRFDLLFDAFARAVKEEPRLKLVLIGRGTHEDDLARRPVEELALGRSVVFAGYRAGAGYDALLAALDVGVFLVPGSDGSCRAARELACASLPLVVTRRGPLPEIVADGSTGRVLDEDPAAFARAFVEFARDDAMRLAFARAARDRAERMFALPGHAAAVEDVYRRVRSARS